MLIESSLLNNSSALHFEPLQPHATMRPSSASRPSKCAPMPLSFIRNAEIYGEGERAEHLYKVTSGIVRTCKFLIDGRRQIGAFYLPGDTFGLETTGEHTFSAEAATDVDVLAVDRDVAASAQLWILMCRELRCTQDRLLLLAKTAPERVASFLLEMAERIHSRDGVELPMSRQDIADYLGLTIETVSRTLTQLRNESAIVLTTSKHIVLRNRAALRRLTD